MAAWWRAAGLGALLMLQPAGAAAQAPPAAWFQDRIAFAAADDLRMALASPAAPALATGRSYAVGITLQDGTGPHGGPTFAHGAAVVSGRDGRGSAFFVVHAGRPREDEPGTVTELSVGYSGAVRAAPHVAAGLTAFYRRVRGGPAGPPGAPDDHYLGLDVGVLAGLSEALTAAAAIERLVEVRQFSEAGPAEPGASRGPILRAGFAFGAGPYVVEADVADPLGSRGQALARVEARLYVAPGSAVRVGVRRRLSGEAGTGWMTGLVLRLPGLPWSLGYAYLAGAPYGGIHQLALVQRGT